MEEQGEWIKSQQDNCKWEDKGWLGVMGEFF